MKQLLSLIMCFLCVGSIFAADAGNLYDGLYSRPTHYPDFTVPTAWPNNMTCYVQAVHADGSHLGNYEVAVFDQNNDIRAIGRSIASQDELCPLTILGTEGDVFHFVVVSGDFDNPDIQHPVDTLSFKTNLSLPPSQPILLNVDGTGLSQVRMNRNDYADRPKKVFENGQIVIVHKGKKYNLVGTLISNEK